MQVGPLVFRVTAPRLSDLPAASTTSRGWPFDVESPRLATGGDGPPLPRISVVVATLNQGPYIERMLRSVLLQGYPDLELIIHDGGSTDGSLEVLRKYDPWITYWTSEPDRGQSHAINKGLARATGDLVCIFDTDDYFPVGSLGAVGAFHAARPDCLIGGDVIQQWEDREDAYVHVRDSDLRDYVAWWRIDHVAGPGVFYPRSIVQRAGLVDEELHYLWDYEFTLRCLAFAPLISLGVITAFMVHTRGSKGIGSANNSIWELAEILKRQYPAFPDLRAESERRLAGMLLGHGVMRLARGHEGGAASVAEAFRTAPLAAMAWAFPGWPWRRLRRLLRR